MAMVSGAAPMTLSPPTPKEMMMATASVALDKMTKAVKTVGLQREEKGSCLATPDLMAVACKTHGSS